MKRILFILFAFILVGCKTIKVVEQINQKDSTAIHYKDSIVWHYRDSINIITKHEVVNDSTSLIIQFGQGGGTYNAKTGEATNVAGVQQTDTRHETKDSTEFYKKRYEAALMTAYELQSEVTDYKSERAEERKQARTGYDRFCSTWFWITAILLLIKIAAWVMEKFPTTAPYVLIARKFIPFL